MARTTEIRYINYYVSGSSAYCVEPQPQPKKKQTALPNQRRKKKIVIHVDPVAILGICVAAIMLVVMVVGTFRLNAAQQEAQRMSDYVTYLQEQNVALRAEYEQAYDPEEIRQIALARGMIPASEAQQVYIQVNVPQQEQVPTAWESFVTFLTGLFA